MSVSSTDYSLTQGGWDFLDDDVLKFFDDILYAEILQSTSYLVELKSFCAMFVFIVLSVKAFRAILGQNYDVFNMVELGKPFMLCAVIINFDDFVFLLVESISVFEDFYNDALSAKILEVNLAIEKRFNLVQDLTELCLEKAQDLDETQQEDDSSTFDFLSGISDTFSELGDFASELFVLGFNKLMYGMVILIEWLAVLLYQAVVYIVFFLRTVFCAILVALGPIVFAISIFPAYERLYTAWISRFVTTYFYGTIAFIALKFSLAMIYSGVESEILFLESALQDPHYETLLLTSVVPWGGAYLISVVLGIVSMVTVPMVAAWIMPAGGVGAAVTKLANSTMAVGKSLTK